MYTENVFFDTEFTGLHKNTTLVSIGLVAASGATFYAELTDYDKSQVDEWLQANVIDNLVLHEKDGIQVDGNGYIFIDGQYIAAKGDREFVAKQIRMWMNNFSNKVKMWADVLAYDWVLFCDLFGGAFNIPKNIYYIPFDIATLMEAKGVDSDISREEFAGVEKDGKHNSKHDAFVCMLCHDKLVRM